MLSFCCYFYCLLTRCLDGKGASDSKRRQEVEIHMDLHYHAYPGSKKLENNSHRLALCLQPPGKPEPDRLETNIIVKKHGQVDFYRI